jgi:hypothetical protein
LLASQNKDRASVTFKKGQSGNPTGRPKLPPGSLTRAETQAIFASMMPEALDRLRALARSDDEKIAIKAVEIIIDRNLGRIPEAQPLTPDEGKVDTVDFVPSVVTSTAAE